MVDIEPIEFAIRGQIDPELTLCVDDDTGCIEHSGFVRGCDKPVRQRIGPDCRRQDTRFSRNRMDGMTLVRHRSPVLG